jgi:hypothetical protein
MIKYYGKKVVYLGQKVPFNNLSSVVAQCKPTHIYTFFVRNQYSDALSELLADLLVNFGKTTTICISGADKSVEKLARDKQVVIIKKIEQLLEMLS